ncbi:hypothetical protein EYC80_010778 [Monilinia laxa]|uniref:Uncharacterized protein n=1 Tax=Monilinia laxa TaxID=61186 RepID=A0A5N6JPY5_MONLA|nr:hypothetical protein EYC80_010778 [Monilinia laxa]
MTSQCATAEDEVSKEFTTFLVPVIGFYNAKSAFQPGQNAAELETTKRKFDQAWQYLAPQIDTFMQMDKNTNLLNEIRKYYDDFAEPPAKFTPNL